MLTGKSKKDMSKSTLRFHLTVIRMALLRKHTTTNAAEDAGWKNSYTLLV